ncbi:MAG: RNA recognition motif-containing protein, partial [Rheinheimera aquimaris]
VGNLPYRANEDAVKELFQRFGIVINVRLMKDRQTGRRRGFGFVEVAAKDGSKMIQKLNDFNFQERILKVREAKERQDNDDSEE